MINPRLIHSVSMMQAAQGFAVSQALYVAAKLGLADLIAAGPIAPAALAGQVGAQPDPLRRLLRVLAARQVFREDAEGRFALTPQAEPLRSGVPGSIRASVILMHEMHYAAWAHLLDAVSGGGAAFPRAFGQSMYAYNAARPEVAALFNASMEEIGGTEVPEVVAAYDFAGLRCVADIGGGNGRLLSAILGSHPHLQGILLDQQEAIAAAQAGQGGPLPRCTLAVGDFLAEVPGGADLYILSNVLWNWPDDDAVRILRSCRAAMGEGTRLLVAEMLNLPGNQPWPGKLLDLHMLVLMDGKVRMEAEHAALMERAGLRLTRVIRTESFTSLIEAVPA